MNFSLWDPPFSFFVTEKALRLSTSECVPTAEFALSHLFSDHICFPFSFKFIPFRSTLHTSCLKPSLLALSWLWVTLISRKHKFLWFRSTSLVSKSSTRRKSQNWREGRLRSLSTKSCSWEELGELCNQPISFWRWDRMLCRRWEGLDCRSEKHEPLQNRWLSGFDAGVALSPSVDSIHYPVWVGPPVI